MPMVMEAHIFVLQRNEVTIAKSDSACIWHPCLPPQFLSNSLHCAPAHLRSRAYPMHQIMAGIAKPATVTQPLAADVG